MCKGQFAEKVRTKLKAYPKLFRARKGGTTHLACRSSPFPITYPLLGKLGLGFIKDNSQTSCTGAKLYSGGGGQNYVIPNLFRNLMTDFFCTAKGYKPYGLINGNLPAVGRRRSTTLFGEQTPCGMRKIICRFHRR